MSLLGPEGLRQVAINCHQNTRQIIAKNKSTSGVKVVFNRPYFHECLVRFDKKASDVLLALSTDRNSRWLCNFN